jgi:hypothetical protein
MERTLLLFICYSFNQTLALIFSYLDYGYSPPQLIPYVPYVASWIINWDMDTRDF